MVTNFWKGFFEALDLEIKNVDDLQGSSGIRHKVLCAGVDEKLKRIVIVQDEQDARILSMVQADVQARIKDYNILMVRPISINLSTAFQGMGLLMGANKFTKQDFADLSGTNGTEEKAKEGKEKLENLLNFVAPQVEIIQRTKPNLVAVFQEIVSQLSHLRFLQNLEENNDFTIDFQEILTYNPVVYDNNLGICSIPLFLFSVNEAEEFFKKKNQEITRAILKKHGIYQFFYPPVDALALGFIEQEIHQNEDLIKHIENVPNFGHPFGENELIDATKLNHVVDALKEKGLVVEGEFSLGVTENGMEKRMLVKFSPRESIFKRLSNVISVKVDFNIKDLFK